MEENLLRARGTETNYDVFPGLVSLDLFPYVLLGVFKCCLNAHLFIKVDIKEIGQLLSKAVFRYIMDKPKMHNAAIKKLLLEARGVL